MDSSPVSGICFVCDSQLWIDNSRSHRHTSPHSQNYSSVNSTYTEEEQENESELEWILFCTYLNVSQEEIEIYKRNYYDVDRILPLCSRCSVVQGKIVALHQEIESIKRKIGKITAAVTATIVNLNNSDPDLNLHHNRNNSPRKKCHAGIQRLRQVVCDRKKSQLPQLNASTRITSQMSVDREFSDNFSLLSPSHMTFGDEDQEDDELEEQDPLVIKEEQQLELELESDQEYEPTSQDDPFFTILDESRPLWSQSQPSTSTNFDLDPPNENEDDDDDSDNDNELSNKSKSKKIVRLGKPPRRKRGKVRNPDCWETNVRKRKRMLGEDYTVTQKIIQPDGSRGYVTVKKPARILGDRCQPDQHPGSGGHNRECHKMPEEDRQRIFHNFWKTMDWNEKKRWVQSAVVMTTPKYRKKGKDGQVVEMLRNRDHTFNYFLPMVVTKGRGRGQGQGQGGRRKALVCRTMFLNSLGLGEAQIRQWVKKFKITPD